MTLWHFVQDNGHLNRDMSDFHIEAGRVYEVSGKPILYKWGLHASFSLLAAMAQAPGHVVSQVELIGEPAYSGWVGAEVFRVGTHRKVLWFADVRYVLQNFMLNCLLEFREDTDGLPLPGFFARFIVPTLSQYQSS